MSAKILVLLIAIPIFYLAGSLPGMLNHKPGVVVTYKGDSVSCTLKGSPGNNVYYKSATDSAYLAVSIDNIKEYRYTKSRVTYKALIIPGGITPRYLRLIDNGKIQLYAFYEQIGKSFYTHLFAVNSAQPMVKVYGYNAGIENETVLKTMIAGCQPALNYLNGQKSYTPKVIANTIGIYNTAKAGSASVNKQP